MLLPPPRTPETEPTLTMSPCPLVSSSSRQARTVANGPRKLTASTKSKNSSSRARRSACGITRVLPALLTKTSSRPSVLSIDVARASIAPVSWAVVRLARWPVPGKLAISRSAASTSLPKVTTTRAPSSAKRRAVEAPRPLLPPVTSATFPSSLPIFANPFDLRLTNYEPILRHPPRKRGSRATAPICFPSIPTFAGMTEPIGMLDPGSAGLSIHLISCGSERRTQGLHKLDQIGLPQLGIEMAEMPVRIGPGRDQHITAVLYPLHGAFDSPE